MKTISIKQPYAHLICTQRQDNPQLGIKDIENRTWPTKFRGLVLVHASAKPFKFKHESDTFTYKQWWNGLTYDQRVLMQSNSLQAGAIIGSVEIVDCVINHPSIWAEESSLLQIATKEPIWNWVLANPVLFAKPIKNVKGKLSFWEYDLNVCHICGQPTEFICQVCDEPFCDNHSAIYDQFNQIDFDCCSECAEKRKWRE